MSARDEHGELPEVGPWAEKKYGLLRTYLTIFSTGMRNLWPTRVYVDLFAGAGRAIIEGTTRQVSTSALIALEVKHAFARYVLCEGKRKLLRGLQARVREVAPDADVRFVGGDCNAEIETILAELPPALARDTLTMCFVDPFGLSGLKFETLRRLAAGRRIDFLVLIPSMMDAQRNEARLTRESDPLLDEFLGGRSWRARWTEISHTPSPPSFGAFIVAEFARSMHGLGYLHFAPSDAAPVDANGLPLYHLALFSKSERGLDFWKKTKRSATKQRELF